ncbi:oxidoreductase [Klebsiella pneumoniae]|nr:oxidoreductase [Klebsiella pneumoniae]MDZ0072573.1 oxidoreductase [Klebsiella pneumoniae]MDZ0084002.1 oxidoreductase [Klebsiella pneumoniae]MDZ0175759.1 oxidoreductase [Klebsiella pneumoniae]MDZ0281512.1 oxidoreductase [Klebsiella pneumoniae]MDZ1610853.1 oxidoreductase [Klebsiella pneumoniae]
MGPDPRNFNQRVSLGRNDLLIRTFLSKLMDLVGAKGTSARVLALNDYTTIIPIDDFYKFPVIMALKMNGQYMRIRDKGPLFIVYPYDSSAELQNQIYYSRSAWQVSKMIIE